MFSIGGLPKTSKLTGWLLESLLSYQSQLL
jgi:hypothetical protein